MLRQLTLSVLQLEPAAASPAAAPGLQLPPLALRPTRAIRAFAAPAAVRAHCSAVAAPSAARPTARLQLHRIPLRHLPREASGPEELEAYLEGEAREATDSVPESSSRHCRAGATHLDLG